MKSLLAQLLPEGVYLIDESKHFHSPLPEIGRAEQEFLVAQEPLGEESLPTFPLVYEGNIQCKLLVVYANTEGSMPNIDVESLNKVLLALSPPIQSAEITLINIAKNINVSWHDITQILSFGHVLVLGNALKTVSEISINHDYEWFVYRDYKLIKANMPSLWKENPREIQILFWTELKKIFNI